MRLGHMYYSSLPITRAESCQLLSIEQKQYEYYRLRQVMLTSIDLNPLRPGKFLFHNFWDVARLGLLLSWRPDPPTASCLDLSVIDDFLDFLAHTSDSEPETRLGQDFLRLFSFFRDQYSETLQSVAHLDALADGLNILVRMEEWVIEAVRSEDTPRRNSLFELEDFSQRHLSGDAEFLVR